MSVRNLPEIANETYTWIMFSANAAVANPKDSKAPAHMPTTLWEDRSMHQLVTGPIMK